MQVKFYSCSNCVGKNTEFIKYCKTSTGKQRYQCISCNKTSVLRYTYNAYKQNINSRIIQLTKEGVGIRSTARILKISATTLLKRIILISQNIVRPVLSFGKTYELDEMRFFVRKKTNPMWLVYSINKETKAVANFYIGRRNNQILNVVIKTLLDAKAEKIYTDRLRNYQYLIPKSVHTDYSEQSTPLIPTQSTPVNFIKNFLDFPLDSY